MIDRAEMSPTASDPDETDAAPLSPRDFEFLLDATKRLLAARGIEGTSSLAVETLTRGLGLARALLMLTDATTLAALRARAAGGFGDDSRADGFELPANGELHERILRAGGPVWLARAQGDEASALFELFGAEAELLALPFAARREDAGTEAESERAGEEEASRARATTTAGVIFVAARREEMRDGARELLARYAECVGAAISNALELERLDAEVRSLRRECERLALILEHVGQPIAVCDTSGQFILLNQSAERLFREREVMTETGRQAARRNSGSLASLISTLTTSAEKSRQAELELIDPDSGEHLPVGVTSAEMTDSQGRPAAFVSILQDLSEIRELERRRVEQQLFESEKLAAVGRLAASIAHEVNNPLEAIKNSLYLISTSSDIEQHARFLEVARKETERVSHIIRQMLGFARRGGEVEWVDVNHLLEETLILLEKKLKQARVAVASETDPALPHVRARADQLRQVFLNLLLNAQQAIGENGLITIRTSLYSQALQPTISVRITDTGRGIEEGELAHVFEPFFSTRAKGTGLGLWVTQDIVRHHGGRIEVSSAPGRGTTFNVILPVNPPTLTEDDAERGE